MIPVFRYEIDAGLAEAVRDQTTIAYLTPILQTSPPADLTERIALAKLTDRADDPLLFYFEDILATSGWNENWDVLTREELWASRHTIDDKPINLGHIYKDIVGHVIGSQAVDAEYQTIPEDTAVADLPDVFHVKNQSVVYRRINDRDRDAYVGQLEEEIRDGKWFVSMEAFFDDFDYGLWNQETGRRWIRARDESTAFLTKHMRQYGGDGFYTTEAGDRLAVGRVLKKTHYKGKGIVKRPGNLKSVIFAETRAFRVDCDGPPIDLGYSRLSTSPSTETEEIPMPEIETSAFDAAQAEIADLKRQLREALDAKLAQRITELEQAVADREADVATAQAETVAAQAIASTFETDLVATRESLSTAQAELASAQAEVAAFKAARIKAARLDAAKAAGFADPAAADLVEKLAVLSDESFNSTIAILRPALAAKPKEAPTPEAEQDAVADAVAGSTDAALIVDTPAAPDRSAKVASIKSDLCDFNSRPFRQ